MASSECRSSTHSTDNEVYMKRTIGLLGGISLVLGIIIGSGIFISPKGVVSATQSEAASLILWAVGGVISTLGALTFAELASLIPKSAGEYFYLRVTYVHWFGFLFAWTVGFLIKPSGQAVTAMTSARYVLVPVFDDGCGEPPLMMIKMLASAIILLLTAVNCFSVRLSSIIQIVFTMFKVAGLVTIVVGGIVQLALGHTKHLATGFEGSNTNPGEFMMGFYSAMYAYDGWAGLNYVVEEIKKPKRNIPLTFYIALPLVTVLYVMTNVSYFTVMDTDQLLESPAVAITWAETVLPNAPWLMPICVALSTFGSCNASIMTSGRLFYVMAREREMPEVLAMIHRQKRTPVPAAMFNCLFAIIYIFASEAIALIDFLGFASWLFITAAQLSVIILRVKMKDAPRTYKVPIVFPIITVLFGITLVILPVVTNPQMEFLYATLIILAGLIFYIPVVIFNKRLTLGSLTVFVQLLLDVCPTTMIAKDEDKTE